MKIAVIAVHGVADQQPGETANTVANLLLHMDAGSEGSRYTGFQIHQLSVPHRKVQIAPQSPNVPGDDSEKCQHQFLRGQLAEYEELDPAATYQTLRIEGVRRGDAPGTEREVHVYEMYWADLSRLGNSFVTFFTELYQLLFHLCTVGTKTARFAAAQHPTMWSWQIFFRSIQFASHCIRLPIPIANLFLLALVVLAASGQVPIGTDTARRVIIGLFCIAAGVLPALWLRGRIPASSWRYVLPGAGLIVALLWLWLDWKITGNALPRLLVSEVWLVLLYLLWQVLTAFDKRHPHALVWGGLIGLMTTALLVYKLCVDVRVIDVCLWTGRFLLKGLPIVWGMVMVAAFIAWSSGICAVWRTDLAMRKAGRRAAFTANLTTAMTGFLMLVINLALWGLVAQIASSGGRSAGLGAFSRIADLINQQLATKTIPYGMAAAMAIMALGAIWAVWSLIPAVLAEMKTPPPKEDSSRWIGRSLTTAFSAMTLSGLLAMGCFSVFLPIVIGLTYFGLPAGWFVAEHQMGVKLFQTFSWLILLFIIAPFFLKGILVKLSAGFRQALDVALDVINYLRENPRERTIRAQIFARYVSLLRYVCNWRASQQDNRGYDRIVIFAHSQGTMITVDVLRFLKVEPDPQLESLAAAERIRLFTMGCPLRQLYGLRFPHIYDWARHAGNRRAGQNLPDGQVPDPTRLLSVAQWVNAYRSGDYVGRNLWRSENDDDTSALEAFAEDAAGKRREFCMGGGAHTHYWDKTAPPIVAELDRLIASP